jgi:photosystem II stability/assembly factor-like uncharacterized protein
MKIIIVFLAFFSASLGMTQTQGWYRQNSGTNAELTQVYFFNKDSGWAVGSGVWYRTTNGGEVWESKPSPSGFAVAHMLDFNTAYAFRGKYVIHTTDQGVTWIDTGNANFNTNIGKVYALDKDTIFALEKYYSRSIDGGKTWVRTDLYPYGVDDAQKVFFLDSQRGYIVGGIAGCGNGRSGISETTDGAKSWHSLCTQNKIKPQINYLYGVFAKDKFIIAVGEYGAIILSRDQGSTWDTTYRYPATGIDLAVTFPTRSIGYIVGSSGIILKSVDSGYHWSEQKSGVRRGVDTNESIFLWDVTFIDSLSGWTVGDGGVILHTINGGQSWVRQSLPTPLETHVSPEPFAGKTTISYSIPRAAKVSIHIYDVTGKDLKVLESPGIQEAGMHSIEFDGSAYPEGVFQYRLESDGFYGMGKMTKIVY